MSLLVRFGLADDGTIYDCGKDVFDILGNLKYDIKILLSWFRINTLQANPGKFQFMILGKKRPNSVKLKAHSTKIEERKKVVLLVVTIDKNYQHFSNDTFQSYYDLFQVTSLVQT